MCEGMDMINGLSDDLLVTILSFLPTKVAVSTSVLSNRWKYLWKRVKKLEYDDTDIITKPSTSHSRFRCFVERNLLIDRDPHLESLSLKLSTAPFQPEDIESWVGFAVSRGVLELSIAYSPNRPYLARLPISLCICKSLVSLKLEESISLRVPRVVRLPSLKILRFQGSRAYLKFNPKVLKSLLYGCPVLEDLSVEGRERELMGKFDIMVPSLRRLSLEINENHKSEDGYIIDTPFLKYFKVKDRSNFHSCSITAMPNLVEAYIDVRFPDIKKFLEPITSVKRLSLCVALNSVEEVYSDGIVFNQLEHLKLCTCDTYWSMLLVRLLQDSPKLRVLELYVNKHSPCSSDPMICWNNQLILQCFATSLETFKWIGCEGRQNERDLVKYILRNARCLKTATVLAESIIGSQRKLEMISELTLLSKASTTCELSFD